ncbi:hypothetical protein ACWA19_08500 [Bacillus toyonensis]
MRYLSNFLKLVYPPVSNQEADWLSDNKDVRNIVTASKLYMIGQREQLCFDNLEFHPVLNGLISFNIKMGDLSSPTIRYSIYNELSEFNDEEDEILIELGEKLIRFTLNTPENVINWFTPDFFIYLLSRNQINVVIEEEFDFTQFSKFKLHYVGISKQGDSFSRLFDQAHHGRLKILTNEYTKDLNARLTDELCIFFFDIEHYNVNVFATEGDVETDLGYYSDKIKVICDAEKAFVKLLDTQYNRIKYTQYPKGNDGLYEDSLFRYGYSILEDLTFYTSTVQFSGSSDYYKASDVIIIEGEEAKIIKPDADNCYPEE